MPLTAAAAGVIGTLGTSAINAASQAATNAQNKRMADEAFRKERIATMEMNAYNSPSSQVARLKAAGLSPALAYGANGEAVGNQSDIPAFNPIPGEAPKVGDLGAPFMDAARLGLETREQLNRDNLAIAENALKDAQSFLAYTQGGLNDAQKKEILDLLGFRVQEAEQRVQLTFEQVNETRARVNEINQNIAESCSRVGLNMYAARELAARYDLEVAEAVRIYELLPHEVQNMDANSTLAWAQSEQAHEYANKAWKEIQSISFYQTLDSRKFDWEKEKFDKEAKMWYTGQMTNLTTHAVDGIAKITGFVVGANAMKSSARTIGQQKIPGPLYVGTGTTEFNTRWER